MSTKAKINTLEHAHQWTHDGNEVLLVKYVAQDGLSYAGKNRAKQKVEFRWPLTVGAAVEAPDWNPDGFYGGGLHGWPWGFGLGDGKDADWSATWLVFGVKPSDIVGNLERERKCKAKAGIVRFVGDWNGAMQFVLKGQMALVAHITSGSTEHHTAGYRSASSATGDRSASSATGDRSASSATGYSSASSATGDRSASSATGYRSASSATGYRSASSATGDRSASSATRDRSASSATGDRSASSATGDRSASSATGYSSASSATGDRSASSATGDRSASSATGYRSASSATGDRSASSATGDRSASIVTGLYGKARAGKFGCIALAWWNSKESRGEMRCGEIGNGDGSDGKLKADVWYSLTETGQFQEVAQ